MGHCRSAYAPATKESSVSDVLEVLVLPPDNPLNWQMGSDNRTRTMYPGLFSENHRQELKRKGRMESTHKAPECISEPSPFIQKQLKVASPPLLSRSIFTTQHTSFPLQSKITLRVAAPTFPAHFGRRMQLNLLFHEPVSASFCLYTHL